MFLALSLRHVKAATEDSLFEKNVAFCRGYTLLAAAASETALGFCYPSSQLALEEECLSFSHLPFECLINKKLK